MRVKLTDKISSYAPPTLRSRFMPGCQWLGTVVVDDGRRGALMLTPAGHYFMVRSFNRTTQLNPELAASAIALAITPAPVHAPRPPGRPAMHGEPMVLFGAKLPRYMLDTARLEGKGNLSRGLRRLITAGMEDLGYEVPDKGFP